MIGALKVFDQAFIVSDGSGGPNYSTLTVVLYLYRTAIADVRLRLRGGDRHRALRAHLHADADPAPALRQGGVRLMAIDVAAARRPRPAPIPARTLGASALAGVARLRAPARRLARSSSSRSSGRLDLAEDAAGDDGVRSAAGPPEPDALPGGADRVQLRCASPPTASSSRGRSRCPTSSSARSAATRSRACASPAARSSSCSCSRR